MAAVKLTPFKADLVRALREVAAEPQNKAKGWDAVDSFSDTDIAAIFGGCISLKGAIKMMRYALIERQEALDAVAFDMETEKHLDIIGGPEVGGKAAPADWTKTDAGIPASTPIVSKPNWPNEPVQLHTAFKFFGNDSDPFDEIANKILDKKLSPEKDDGTSGW